ncbi:MAG: 23S rRNA (guanosine(2251)-2'-O)-methyltransferase RlmB [Clostridia bacterium]|nr:23S rRNA (guanosine(2251)-2'-O)-methyltransferase RlmB [Clostridia bacterium]
MDKKEGLIVGRNAVMQALESDRTIDSVTVAEGQRGGQAAKIIEICREKMIPVKYADSRKLDKLCGGAAHQGVAAFAAAHDYAELDDIFNLAQSRGESPFIVICDGLEDPHNLGAILRTAEAAGVHGVIIPKRNSVTLNYTVAKTSAGAIEYVPVVKVTNIAGTIDTLKGRGVWVFGADMEGTPWTELDFTGSIALVIGSEGRGLSKLVREKCDFIASLPMKGKINSLNASVAAGILMFEASRQRK